MSAFFTHMGSEEKCAGKAEKLTGIWRTDTGKTVSLHSFNFKRYSKEDVLSQPAKVKILTLFSELCTYRK